MKKAFLLPISLLAFAAISFTDPPNPMVGRWQREINGVILLFNFRPEGTYDAFVNGKSYLTGQYYVRQDTIGVTDGKCNPTYYGIYKMSFTVPDSVRFTAIQDTCRERREAVATLVLGRVAPDRVKPTKP